MDQFWVVADAFEVENVKSEAGAARGDVVTTIHVGVGSIEESDVPSFQQKAYEFCYALEREKETNLPGRERHSRLAAPLPLCCVDRKMTTILRCVHSAN